ncbi:putative NADH dehydrogenase [ubiquinone] 1 alpha subcomplex assembly factor 4 [Lupinus albus]|uniref:Putative NADH dehydrogenase [ubiquinone] 1 alpha subcomplex assembly factor 4 n=1 Tax=Lupinus albus TaxID=3870 RepID=A0A6A4NQ83_LUPAL|nr:putative NADH dehydrogenase [ubiquinone] 1 alpha subcomplex assembly factor 4 [Lupinus albus]
MGQAFRRASGRFTAPSDPKTVAINHRPPPPKPSADNATEISKAAKIDALNTAVNVDNILEERDRKYDVMLGQMVGRIRSKPEGKPEMGEAFLVQKSTRPMPRLRNTKPDSGSYEERQVPTGTLNISQLRHIILLHEGKADDHNGPMGAHQIAEKFKVDVVQIQSILQFLSKPPEDNNSKDKNKSPR